MKRNILIISIYYPPIQSIASNRLYSFAKYLDKDKYRVFVHTLDDNTKYKNDLKDVSISRIKNDSLLKPFLFQHRTNKIIHYGKVIYNIFIKKITKNIYQKWIDESYKLLKEKIEKEKIDLMISSFAPDASHILALKLKQEFPQLKWIADMRDEMSFSPYIDSKIKSRYQVLEQQIFTYANAITTVSKPILDEFKSMCPNNKVLFSEIRNGYDFSLEKREVNNDVFTLTYVGSFYGDRNPINFFKALELFIRNNHNIELKVQLIGVKTHFEIPKILKEMIEILPTVSHDKAIEFMKQSDALLLIHPSNGRKGVFTGKLFEYLGVLKPILALIDEEDVAAALIKKVNAGYISDNTNIKKIEKNITLLYNMHKKREKRNFELALIQKHHRKEQVKRLEVIIEESLVG